MARAKYARWQVARDLKTGRFIPMSVAKRRKKSAVIITMKRRIK